MVRLLKTSLLVLGLLFTALAVLGAFLPILPTTPLLLLALACFARSSDRLHERLLTHRIFGPVIRQWHETRSMPFKAKIWAIIAICITGGISFITLDTVQMKALLIAILIIPVIIILRIRTAPNARHTNIPGD